MKPQSITHASFGQRFIAMIIDNIIFGIALTPIVLLFFDQPNYSDAEIEQILKTQGPWGLINSTELFFQQGLILLITVFFWTRYAGTPGKRIMKISVVDTKTLQAPNPQQSIIRYLGYFVSAMPFGMGFLWMLMDEKKQCWHDKFANTLVISGPIPTNKVNASDSTIQHTHNRDDDNTFAA